MANVIYRGSTQVQPTTVNLPVTSAALPGSMVVVVGETVVVAVAADVEKNLLVLSNNEFIGQSVETVYVSGDTATAYETKPGDQFQARMAAATYAVGDRLSIGASGRLEAVVTGEVVVARFTGTAGAIGAGVLADITIANSFVKA
tara:strand:+ start:204 stop:638 length:435 start_codon:yes stop_codon:yes gene_type:complete